MGQRSWHGRRLESVSAQDAYYFLPSEDEWYKAAFHKNDGPTANYWDYATGSNTIPTSVISGTSPNTAVYDLRLALGQHPADVGIAGGLSPYGTRGQNGNEHEWTESAYDEVNDSSDEVRAARGVHLILWSTIFARRIVARVPLILLSMGSVWRAWRLRTSRSRRPFCCCSAPHGWDCLSDAADRRTGPHRPKLPLRSVSQQAPLVRAASAAYCTTIPFGCAPAGTSACGRMSGESAVSVSFPSAPTCRICNALPSGKESSTVFSWLTT